MAWGSAFVEQLSRASVAPLYVLESIQIGLFLPGQIAISSFLVEGYAPVMALESSGVNYGRLKLPEGSMSFGSLTIGLTGEWDPRPDVRRGMAVQLRIGFDGWSLPEFETVFTGVVWNVSWTAGQWSIVVRDIFAGLDSRYIGLGATLDDYALFGLVPTTTTLTADYTVGDGSVSVTATSAFEREDGGSYLLLVESDTTAPFYLKAPSSTATSFTVTEADTFGTTRVSVLVADNAKVTEVAYIEQRPCIAAKSVLISTGTPGTHGPDDTLPEGWGFALPLHMVDASDISFFNTTIGPAFSRKWDIFSLGQESPIRWLEGMLASGGYFLTQVQGRITIRGLAPPEKLGTTPNHVTLTEGDIVEVVSYATYDDNLPVEYAGFRVTDANTDFSETLLQAVNTRPARNQAGATATHVWANGSDWRGAILDQLGPWYTRVSEILRLRLRGWRAGQMAAGDTCTVLQTLIRDRLGRPTGDRLGLVLECHPNWFTATTDVVVAYLPTSESEP
jgi:hypothetical protein